MIIVHLFANALGVKPGTLMGDTYFLDLSKYDDLIVLRSENPNYKDMEYKPEDEKEIHVLGKAMKFQGELR